MSKTVEIIRALREARNAKPIIRRTNLEWADLLKCSPQLLSSVNRAWGFGDVVLQLGQKDRGFIRASRGSFRIGKIPLIRAGLLGKRALKYTVDEEKGVIVLSDLEADGGTKKASQVPSGISPEEAKARRVQTMERIAREYDAMFPDGED